MNIDVSQKEFKNNKLDIGALNIASMLALRNKHPEMWEEFLKFVSFIENYGVKNDNN